ncbi:MAG: hypothetical protein NTY38_22530 [Acidobacteria bacterium]|nr:hypothetical protein [Acidobacteriota bacterium]
MFTRRTFLGTSAAAAFASGGGIRREVVRSAPAPGTAVMEYAYYTRPRGGDMLSIETRWSRSDTVDAAYYRFSTDHGRTWTAPESRRVNERRTGGMWRQAARGAFPDPSGVTLEFWIEGLLPTDDPLEGLRRWAVWYAISTDGGRTRKLSRQILQQGREFTPAHPIPGVETGKNCYMLGDVTNTPLFLRDGSLLLPAVLSPLSPDGTLYNPTGGYTYTDVAMLHGRWKGAELEWELRARIAGDPATSTRGMDEPTLAMLKDGTILAILRGSNDRNPALPGRKWMAVSQDQGRSFTRPRPWTYTDGENFFSPSACSQLVQHSSARLFWLGNITGENPKGNRPRYPFVIGEVDRSSGLLIRKTVRKVDDLNPGDDPVLSLSNFYAREDRLTGDIHLHLTRLFASRDKPWAGDANLYRIPAT